MARFIGKRLGLGLITLLLLSLLVFFGTQVLPGDEARRILGPFASQSAVNALNKQLGTDKSVFVQYLDWITGVLHGDLGTSVATRTSVSSIVFPALWHSAKLALLAFIIVVPLGILGGVLAALNEGKTRDRLISVGGLSATTVPEFVWAVALILVFALWLGIFPSTATAPPGSSFFTQIEYLILPALCLVFVLFGYIARMARAGTIEALEADYTRTAVIKGLPYRTVVRRHVLRELAAPDDRGGRHADGLPDRRAGRDRVGVQLPGHRSGAIPRGDPEGLSGAGERRTDRRRRLPHRHSPCRPRLLAAQSPDPIREFRHEFVR